jgi:DNA-directed RNA polymerase subunit RPC12/RpoP
MPIKVKPVNWVPQNKVQARLEEISQRFPEFVKCGADPESPSIVIYGLMVVMNGVNVYVHPEETTCEYCGHRNSMGAVPDYGFPYDEAARIAIDKAPKIKCESCGKTIFRRTILWRSDMVE